MARRYVSAYRYFLLVFRRFQPDAAIKFGGHFRFQIFRASGTQVARQRDIAVAHADETADLRAHRFPHAPHLTVAAFLENDVIPAVGALAAGVDDGVEVRRPVVQQHALPQLHQHGFAHLAENAHGVLAFDFARGMHQTIGQFAVGGKEQQPGGAEVETTDGNPAATAQHRKFVEHGRAALGIRARTNFTRGFVIDQHEALLYHVEDANRAPIEKDTVGGSDALTERSELTVYRDAALADPLLDGPARAASR